MADDADIRSVLREHGVEVPHRGRLSAVHRAEYEKITGRGDEPAGEAWDGPDDEADITEAVLPPDPGPAPDPGETGPVSERKPRRVRPARPSLSDRIRGTSKQGPAKKRPKVPRVPVDQLIGRFWETAARLASPVSQPVARTLALQAPVAGLILEDTVKGTIIDRGLQPLARAEQRAEKVIALAGPPLVVLAIERAQGLESPRREMQLALLEPMLVESLTMWVRIADGKMEAARERVQATAEVRGQVEALVAAIFPAPEPMPEPGPEFAGARM